MMWLTFTTLLAVAVPTLQAEHIYRMCVPEPAFQACQEMSAVPTTSGAQIQCVKGRDRIECLEEIKERKADFGTFDPEDMYVAFHLSNEDFQVIKEIRTKEEPSAEFRYEGVSVIHKDLPITNVSGIRGLNSCHTGVGRNVGYKIPLTKLRKMGLIGGLNDYTISPRENELKAFSQLFKKACIVGKWAPDPVINARLKTEYANLCALCEHPEVCDYPDNFSGYEGALRCLAHNGGEIAWTKVIFVRKFFGLPVGVTPAVPTQEDHTQYRYLCPDGTRRPIDGPACTWAARPWQGYLSNADVRATIGELREKLTQLNVIGDTKEQPEWFASVLLLNNKTVAVDNDIISPQEYLTKAKYTDVIERDVGPPRRSVRFCVTSFPELQKCRALRKAAYSRDIRPAFDCVQAGSINDCLQTIRDNGADVITLDAGLVIQSQRKHNLRPILAEQYPGNQGSYYAVAIVKKSSSYQSLQDLKGARSCHTGFGRTAGYNAPLHVLRQAGLIAKDKCPLAAELSKFFSAGSCLPGSLDEANNPNGQNPAALCSQCSNPTECKADTTELYHGYSGAFRCLVEGHGDVAFAKHVTVPGNTDGNNQEEWAKNLKKSDYELLCPKGGRAPVDEYEKCFLTEAPPHMVVTSNSKTENEIDAIKHALISTAQLFSKHPDYFKLFGSFDSHKDLLFKDFAVGLVSVEEDAQILTQYTELVDDISSCDT